MATAMSQYTRTAAEFEQEPMEVVKQARKTKQPVFITIAGKPGVVVVDAATYLDRIRTANLSHLLEEGERDVRVGRLHPADQVLKELDRAKKVSR